MPIRRDEVIPPYIFLTRNSVGVDAHIDPEILRHNKQQKTAEPLVQRLIFLSLDSVDDCLYAVFKKTDDCVDNAGKADACESICDVIKNALEI